MSRVWQPGDLVAVPFEAGHRMLLVTEYGGVFSDGYGVEEKAVREFSDVRPLVVIDPEDREQVERFVRALPLDWNLDTVDDPELFHESVDQVSAALREFADPKPPKPAEPTGLGAVVEDERGVRWVRTEPGNGMTNPWQATLHVDEPDDVRSLRWAEVVAVKVLSEGVTP